MAARRPAGTSPSPRTHTAGRARRRCRRRRGRLPGRPLLLATGTSEGTPVEIGVVFCFCRIVERRFLRQRRQADRRCETPASGVARSAGCRDVLVAAARRLEIDHPPPQTCTGQAKRRHAPYSPPPCPADRSARSPRCCRFAGSSPPPGRAATATASSARRAARQAPRIGFGRAAATSSRSIAPVFGLLQQLVQNRQLDRRRRREGGRRQSLEALAARDVDDRRSR